MPTETQTRVSLYDVEDTLLAFLETAELVPADDEAFKKDLMTAVEASKDKRESVGRFILQCEATAGFAAEERKRLADRERVFTNIAKRLRAYVADLIVSLPMVMKGKKASFQKLEGHTLTMAVRSNPASLSVEMDKLDPAYHTLTFTVPFAVWQDISGVLMGADREDLIETVLKDKPPLLLDTKAIRKALTDGEEQAEARGELFAGIPGAKLESGGVSLRIS